MSFFIMSFSSRYPGVSFDAWARQQTQAPEPEHSTPPNPMDVEQVHARLMRMGYDTFHNEPLRYPRCPPTPEDWAAHLQRLEQSTGYLQERTFDQDSASLEEAATPEEQCINGKACVTYSQHDRIAGLETRGPIILRRLDPPHAPMCLLCHRYMFVSVLCQDRLDRGLLNHPSQLAQPGPDPYVLKQLRPVQSFYNLRDVKGEYSSKFVCAGTEEDDLVVLPMARLSLKVLIAFRDPVTNLYSINQDAMKYIHDPTTDIEPGETVQQLKERVSQRPWVPEIEVEWLEN